MAHNQRRALEAALEALEPRIRRAFEEAIQRASAAINMNTLVDLLERGRLEDAASLLAFERATFWPVAEAIRGGFLAGGQMGAKIAPRGLTGFFGFDGRHERAERWVSERGARFIQGTTDEQADTVRQVIRQGLEQGRSSRSVARELVGRRVGSKRVGGLLGLNSPQAESIMSARAKLASGDPALMREYLGLKLRDRRLDGRVKKAIKEGRAITGRDLDQIMEAHRSKALTYRSRVIAKFEAREALAAGREEAMFQLRDRPDVEAITVRWQHNLSKEPRDSHVAMNGKVIELGQVFEFPDGVRMQRPHDPIAPLSHRLGCNCMAIYRVRLRRA